MDSTQELSYGQKAVGLTFNPSGDANVQAIKEAFAKVIDICNDLRNSPIPDTMKNSNERNRMLSVAITESQAAQMWAVKAVTWKD